MIDYDGKRNRIGLKKPEIRCMVKSLWDRHNTRNVLSNAKRIAMKGIRGINEVNWQSYKLAFEVIFQLTETDLKVSKFYIHLFQRLSYSEYQKPRLH